MCCCLLTGVQTQSYTKEDEISSILGPIYSYSTTPTHTATYLSLESNQECNIPDTRNHNVRHIVVTPYFPRHFSNKFPIFACSVELMVLKHIYFSSERNLLYKGRQFFNQ